MDYNFNILRSSNCQVLGLNFIEEDLQRWETEPLSIDFRYIISILVLEFEDLQIFIGMSSVFKELGASIEADFLVLAYSYQPIFIAIGNIDDIDTVL